TPTIERGGSTFVIRIGTGWLCLISALAKPVRPLSLSIQHTRSARTQKTASGSPIRGIELLLQGPDNSGRNRNPEELTWPTSRARQPEVLSELIAPVGRRGVDLELLPMPFAACQ